MRTSELRKTSPFVYRLLAMQYKVAGGRIQDELIGGWYSDTVWTEQQEKKYKGWFIKTLLWHRKATSDAFTGFIRTKADAEKAWNWWNLMYGFRVPEVRE